MKLTFKNSWLARDASIKAYPEQFIVRVMAAPYASKAFDAFKTLTESSGSAQGICL